MGMTTIDPATTASPPGSASEKNEADRLRLAYRLSLGLIAAVILVSTVLLDRLVDLQADQGHIINIAGRQRMLSQRIAKSVLALPNEPTPTRVGELEKALDLWARSHRGLREGSLELQLPGRNSPEVDALFANLEDDHRAILWHVGALLGMLKDRPAQEWARIDYASSIAAVLAHEGPFLETMDRIVFQYDREARARVAAMERMQIGLAALQLLLLAGLGAFVFRPAVRHARQSFALAERHQVELSEAVAARTRELTAERAALQRSEAHWKGVFETTLDAIVGIDATGRIQMFNAAAERLFGHAAAEAIGQDAAMLMPEHFRAAHQAGLERYVATEIPHVIGTLLELEGLRRDGSVCPIEMTLVAVKTDVGLRFTAVIRDITRRKQAEDALRQANLALEEQRSNLAQTVERRTAELRDANLSLEQAMRVKNQFLSTMSHELRTPMHGILGFADLLDMELATAGNAELREYLESIRASGKRLNGLIDAILEMARCEMGSLQLHKEPLQPGALAEQAVDLLRAAAAEKRQTLRVEVAADIQSMNGDAQRLKVVLFNLLGNAIKFTPAGGRIELRVTADAQPGWIRFTVSDNGIGIASADRERIFQPFTQADGGITRQHEGSGLGLALANRLVQLHGGRIELDSEPGKGSAFGVVLPL